VHFQTGYFSRGGPIFNFVREQVQSGNLGTVTRCAFPIVIAGRSKVV